MYYEHEHEIRKKTEGQLFLRSLSVQDMIMLCVQEQSSNSIEINIIDRFTAYVIITSYCELGATQKKIGGQIGITSGYITY